MFDWLISNAITIIIALITILISALTKSPASHPNSVTINNNPPVQEILDKNYSNQLVLGIGSAGLLIYLVNYCHTLKDLINQLEDEDLWCNWRIDEISLEEIQKKAEATYQEIMQEAEFKYGDNPNKKLIAELKKELEILKKVQSKLNTTNNFKISFLFGDKKLIDQKIKRIKVISRILYSMKKSSNPSPQVQ